MLTAASTALLDTAESDNAGDDDSDADSACDDANLSSLGQRLPAVSDAAGFLDLLDSCRLAPTRESVILQYSPTGNTYSITFTFCQSPLESMSSQEYSLADV